jgi:predicted MFS family arabinose efflux permease
VEDENRPAGESDAVAESLQAASTGAPDSLYSRDFWLVSAATFALNVALNFFVLLPVFIVRLGGHANTIGVIIASAGLAALIARPGASFAVDRRGRRWTAMSFLILNAFAMAAFIPVHSLGWPIYLVSGLNGIANGTARVALFAMVYPLLPRGREGKAMAIQSLSGQGPASFGALLGEAIMRHFGFTALFAAAASLCLFAAITIAIVSQDTPQAHHAAPPSAAKDAGGYVALLRSRALMPLWIATFCFGFAISSRASFIAPFAYRQGIASIGVYFTLYGVVAVFVRLSGSLMDRFGFDRMIAPSFAVMGVGIALVALTGHIGMLEIAALIGGLGHGFAYPLLSAMVIRDTPAGHGSRVSSIYMSMWDLSGMMGPFMLGIIAHFAGYATMFVLAGTIAMGAAVYLEATRRSWGRDPNVK